MVAKAAMPERPDEDLAGLSTMQLVARAVDEARQLVRLEIDLAKQDLRSEIKSARRAARDLAIAYACAVLAIATLVTALAVGAEKAMLAVVTAIASVVAGAIATKLGIDALPRRPLQPTQQRLRDDLDRLKEHVA
jgi:hypothetical protein